MDYILCVVYYSLVYYLFYLQLPVPLNPLHLSQPLLPSCSLWYSLTCLLRIRVCFWGKFFSLLQELPTTKQMYGMSLQIALSLSYMIIKFLSILTFCGFYVKIIHIHSNNVYVMILYWIKHSSYSGQLNNHTLLQLFITPNKILTMNNYY